MENESGIINPVKGKKSPVTGEIAILIGNQVDLTYLLHVTKRNPDKFTHLFMSKLYTDDSNSLGACISGPFIGAPYAVMLLENLIAWGVNKVIFVGWCGSVCENVKTGDVIIADSAWSDEGTSKNYCSDECIPSSETLTKKLKQHFTEKKLDFHIGPLWTTDAIYRETKSKVNDYKGRKTLGVEMECSALFSVGKFRKIDVASVQVVSDELSTLDWKPGFGSKLFKKNRKAAIEAVYELCQKI